MLVTNQGRDLTVTLREFLVHAKLCFFKNRICECFSNPLIFATIIASPYSFAVRNTGFRLLIAWIAVNLLFSDELHSENQLAFQQSDS